VERLRAKGFQLLDTQWMTDHLKTFGGYEMPQQEYLELLKPALA
jgi:leucyl/phenylalanyl-tRNA--protein transferase